MEEAVGEFDDYTYKPTRVSLDPALRTEQEWCSLNLCKPLIRALREMEYECPTLIQRDVIPEALAGHDILARSHTGSGKTAAFLIPCLNRLAISPMVRRRKLLPASSGRGGKLITNMGECITKVLILLPTRELAAQCFGVCQELSLHLPITSCVLSGGSNLPDQERKVRACPDIIICTPGRCLDVLLNTQNVHLDLLDILVFDEADKLVDLGFRDVCLSIVKRCSPRRQTMMFSATLTGADLASYCLNGRPKVFGSSASATEASSAQDVSSLPANLKFEFVGVGQDSERLPALIKILKGEVTAGGSGCRVLVFFNTKLSTHSAAVVLKSLDFLPAVNEIHGDLSHQQRVKAIKQFQDEEVTVILATDLIARGIDLEDIHLVIHAELPSDPSTTGRSAASLRGSFPDWLVKFIHRSGRTGRAGQSGRVIALYNYETEKTLVKSYQKFIKGEKRACEIKRLDPDDLEAYAVPDAKQLIKAHLSMDRIEKDLRVAQTKLNKEKLAQDPEAQALKVKREWIAEKKASLISRVQKKISKTMVTTLAEKKQLQAAKKRKADAEKSAAAAAKARVVRKRPTKPAPHKKRRR